MGDSGNKCFSTTSQNALVFSIVTIETLVIIPCVIFTLINIIEFDNDTYKHYHQDFAKVIAFHFLAPLLAVQALWLLTNILSLLAVHLTTPYLLLPNICVVFLGLIICLVMIGPSVDCLVRSEAQVKWPMTVFVVGLAIFIIALLLFVAVRIATFRKLVKKKKAVQTTAEKEVPEQQPPPEAPLPPAPDPEISSVSFSRRSTMSITEDRYCPPPRM
ncbi:unnamed protein product [Caenorhabditis bovis]|uniref:Uncharacterized protein n=1 Tax=Caenorhabditis bovis TaxID=2654633 RepID=A0A8S1EFR1_9PELO|nr:unnamed protein product [Caenorhabditis bovis]